MDYGMVLTAVFTLFGLSLLLGVGLSVGAKIFSVSSDPRLEQLVELLPNVNCGACGFGGCRECARAMLEGRAKPNVCPLCRGGTVDRISEIAGQTVEEAVPFVARVYCRSKASAPRRYFYQGVADCRSVAQVGGGETACSWGCLRYYNCVRSCPFDAFDIDSDGNPVVDPERCRSCRICVKACPRGIIQMVPADKRVDVVCSSQDPAGKTAKSCPTGCIACGRCVKVCPRDAIVIKDNLARITAELCDGCGQCVEACPRKIIYNLGLKPVVSGEREDG